MRCQYCKRGCIKAGKARGVQRYQCNHCKKYQQKEYCKPRIPLCKYKDVKELTCEGMGINSIGRYLKMASSSVQRIIERLSSVIAIPIYHEGNHSFEMDELRTYSGTK